MVVAASVAVAVAMSGCASGATAEAEPAASDRASTGAGAGATIAIAELPTGVIGAARLAGAGGEDLGRVEFVSDGSDEVEVRLSGLPAADELSREVLLAPDPLDDGQACFDTGVRFALGNPDSVDGWAGVTDVGDVMMGDPSFLDEVVVVSTPDIAAQPAAPVDCLAVVVGRGPIEWSFEPLRSGLLAVDGGPTGGARGAVAVDDGVPVAYTVFGDDLVDDVAARFGLTVEELLYLNPTRMPSPQATTLQVGEVLNLSVAQR